jgi:hypothetical protein
LGHPRHRPKKNTLAQCYSHNERQWILLENSDYYLKELLVLSFRPTKENERKRVGPPPSPGEIDRRRLWNPQLFRDGKKVAKAECEVVRALWPSDKSKLSGCTIELYLDATQPNFAFPYWLEVQSPNFTFKVRVADSGRGAASPMPLVRRNIPSN